MSEIDDIIEAREKAEFLYYRGYVHNISLEVLERKLLDESRKQKNNKDINESLRSKSEE